MTSTAVRPLSADRAAQQRAHRGHRVDVERGERLVEQQQVGAGGQRAGQRDPLLLAAGELPRPPLGERTHVDGVEQLPGAGQRGPAGHALGPRPERHVGQRRQVREQQGLLGQQTRRRAGAAGTCTRRRRRSASGRRAGRARSPGAAARRARRAASTCPPRWGRAPRAPRRARRASATSRVKPERWTTTAASSPAATPPVTTGLRPSRERPTAITTTATATSSSDSATAPSTSVSRCRYTSSGSVRVVPCRLPAKAVVAPNSPRQRANASTEPEARPGSTSGTVTCRNA